MLLFEVNSEDAERDKGATIADYESVKLVETEAQDLENFTFLIYM